MTTISADLEIKCLNCLDSHGIRKWNIRPEITMHSEEGSRVTIQVKELALICPSCALIHRVEYGQPTGEV